MTFNVFSTFTEKSNKMVKDSEIIKQAVDGALEEIKKHAPWEYLKLEADQDKMAELIEEATATATETVKLSKEFIGQPLNIAERLAKHLPEDRIKLIRGALEIPTFRMEVTKHVDGRHWLIFKRNGEDFFPAHAVTTDLHHDIGDIIQKASILVEAIMLVMSAVGISVSASSRVVEKAVNEAANAIRSSSVLARALDDFVASWNSAGSAFSKAKAVFYLVKDSHAAGILWNTIKCICSEMSWFEWVKTAAKVTAMIIAALATDGVALIAEIALIVLNAVDFGLKMANIVLLKKIKETL